MKRYVNLLMILLLVGFLAPRAQSEVYMDYEFPDTVLWQIGGFEVYDVMQRGAVVGESTVGYSKMEMLNEPAYRIEWTQSWTTAEGEKNEISADVKMRSSDLKALMATSVLKIGDEEWRYEGNYTGQTLEFGTYYPGKAQREEASLTRSGRYHDMDILPFLLRNIPFEEGNFITLTVVDVSTHSFITPIASVVGSEIVETATTQYDCWVVNVSVGIEGFTAWYAKNDQHFLVKIRYNDRELVLNHHS